MSDQQVGPERFVESSGVRLCVQAFGDPGAPAVLLICGAAGGMEQWEDGFCEQLAGGGRFVIRYDHRDTGRSGGCPPGAPDYTFRELVADPLAVLDGLGVGRAHLVGVSMGGGIAQAVAIEHPERMATLTLIATSPVGPTEGELPSTDARLGKEVPEPDWSERDAVVEYLVAGERRLAGSLPFHERARRELAGRAFDRAVSIASAGNHWRLSGDGGPDYRMEQVTAPALVMHGTEDPFFPFGHGEALAAAIPGARLVPLDRMGHQMPPPELWDTVVPAVLEHTAQAEGA